MSNKINTADMLAMATRLMELESYVDRRGIVVEASGMLEDLAASREKESHGAVTDGAKNQSCLSWNGFNLMGDEKSISEAERLLSGDGRLEALESMIRNNQLCYAVAPLLRGAPEGYALVPIEPTQVMIEAGIESDTNVIDSYMAMLAAAKGEE